jgi:hypothetical protein
VDAVNHPSHYTSGPIEVWDYITQVCDHYPGPQAAAVCNVIKYVSRAPLKHNKLQDLKKARWYLDVLIALVDDEAADSVGEV